MWGALVSFGVKYLWEIIAAVCLVSAIGLVYWKAQSWCNAACREQRILVQECDIVLKKTNELLAKERAERAKDKQYYMEQQALWQRQVDDQLAEIENVKAANQAIVEKHRKPFSDIFKRNTQNEQKAQVRINSNIKPSDVVTAPLALMREYNEAVARAPAAKGSGGGEGRLSSNPTGAEDQVATFSALAVTETLVENVNRYNQLALKCDALVDIVVDLEARYGNNSGGTDGPASKP
jgi:hypothetical protein